MGHFHARLPLIHVEEQENSMVSCCVFHSVQCEGAEEGKKKLLSLLQIREEIKMHGFVEESSRGRESNMLI